MKEMKYKAEEIAQKIRIKEKEGGRGRRKRGRMRNNENSSEMEERKNNKTTGPRGYYLNKRSSRKRKHRGGTHS